MTKIRRRPARIAVEDDEWVDLAHPGDPGFDFGRARPGEALALLMGTFLVLLSLFCFFGLLVQHGWHTSPGRPFEIPR